MKASKNNKIAKGGQEITLMTVLANEATGPSRKLLKQYGQPDAKNYQDLEVKLAELYFNTKDKVELEKQLAEIHPHKNWILKNVQPVIEEKSKQEQIEEVKSNATGDNICPQCNRKNRELDFLYAEGTQQPTAKSDLNMLIVPVVLLAMVGLTYIVVLKGIQK
jgi:CHASE3 domain sensor protein